MSLGLCYQAGDPATHSISDTTAHIDSAHAAHFGATAYSQHTSKRSFSEPDTTSLPPGKCSKSSNRVQLTFVPCCSAFTAYKHQHGIAAKVYTAIVTPESHTSSTVADKVVSDSSTTVFSPLLAYTVVDHAPSVSVTETNGACDNKQDILMQS